MKRVLVLEITGTEFSVATSIRNAFAAMAALGACGVQIRAVAMPLLGTGSQKLLQRLLWAR